MDGLSSLSVIHKIGYQEHKIHIELRHKFNRFAKFKEDEIDYNQYQRYYDEEMDWRYPKKYYSFKKGEWKQA